LVVLERKGRRFTARFDGKVADNNLYTVVLLDTLVTAVATDAVLIELNARFPESPFRCTAIGASACRLHSSLAAASPNDGSWEPFTTGGPTWVAVRAC
jgi:hypothetical protein